MTLRMLKEAHASILEHDQPICLPYSGTENARRKLILMRFSNTGYTAKGYACCCRGVHRRVLTRISSLVATMVGSVCVHTFSVLCGIQLAQVRFSAFTYCF